VGHHLVAGLELERGETMGDHHVSERAVVHVVSGRVSIDASGGTVECTAGTLVTFAPGERHSVHAAENATLLGLLAPWPAAQHYTDAEAGHGSSLPPARPLLSSPRRAATPERTSLVCGGSGALGGAVVGAFLPARPVVAASWFGAPPGCELREGHQTP
jgi:hypothetical protein